LREIFKPTQKSLSQNVNVR